MIQPVTTTTPAVTTPAVKPWAPGDPSSFEQLFSNFQATPTSAPTATTPAPAPAPAAAPFTFVQGATVNGFGTTTPMNPEELATGDTAAKLATMIGGTVVTEANYGGGWTNSAPTRDIDVTVGKETVTLNAGITAYLFNTYGSAPGSQAWQQINALLGRDPMSTGPTS